MNLSNLEERMKEKQRSRDEDDECIINGEMTPEEINKKNGFASSLDLTKSKIIRRNIKFGG